MLSKDSTTAKTSAYTFMGANIVMNIFLGGLISLLWGALNNLSSLTIHFLIAVPVSDLAQAISSMILNFAQLQVLPSDQINSSMLKFNASSDAPLNDYFDLVGYQSSNAIKNLGSTFVFLILNVFLLLIIGMFKLLKCTKAYNYLASKVLWNYIIRFMIQQYVTLCLSSLINLYRIDLSQSGDITSIALVFILIPLVVATPFVLGTIVMMRASGKISEETFEKQFSSLSQGLRQATSVQRLWTVLNIFKWLGTCTVLVALRDYPGPQLISLLNISAIF